MVYIYIYAFCKPFTESIESVHL